MDIAIPSDDKQRKARNAACVLSIPKGSVPYLRHVGLRTDIDASAPAGAQRLAGYAAQDIEASVKGAQVEKCWVQLNQNGKADVKVLLRG